MDGDEAQAKQPKLGSKAFMRQQTREKMAERKAEKETLAALKAQKKITAEKNKADRAMRSNLRSQGLALDKQVVLSSHIGNHHLNPDSICMS